MAQNRGDVKPCAKGFWERDHLRPLHMIVQEFLASGINAVRFVRQSPASDHFVVKLELEVFISLYFRFTGSEPLTTCEACATVSSNMRSL